MKFSLNLSSIALVSGDEMDYNRMSYFVGSDKICTQFWPLTFAVAGRTARRANVAAEIAFAQKLWMPFQQQISGVVVEQAGGRTASRTNRRANVSPEIFFCSKAVPKSCAYLCQ